MRLIKLKALIFLIAISLGATAYAKDGDSYRTIPGPQVLDQPDDGRIEVISFFWYGCGTCYSIDSDIGAWASKLPTDVRFIRKHVDFGGAVSFHAKLFLTLRQLGLSHQADLTVFRLFRQDRKPVNNMSDLPRLAQALGMDEKKLTAAFNSKETAEAEKHLARLMEAYNVDGVPAIVIDGKYIFDIGQTDGLDGFFKQADELIEKSREARRAGTK